MAPAVPQMMGPSDDDDVLAEVTRETVAADRRVREARMPKPGAGMTRRSWYVERAAADTFNEVVEEMHFQTRLPKHRIASALLYEAAARAGEAEKRLMGSGKSEA